MKKRTLFFGLIALAFSLPVWASSDVFYSQNLTTLEGKKYPFSKLKGKTVLIVNTASECGYTPQLKDLETLYQKYSSQGFVVLAIPSNDFKQEKSTSSEILKVAQQDYKTTFTFLEKQQITGPDKSELFKYLTNENKNVLLKEISWNFEKFLVNKSGQVVERWKSSTTPLSDEMIKKIEQTLK